MDRNVYNVDITDLIWKQIQDEDCASWIYLKRYSCICLENHSSKTYILAQFKLITSARTDLLERDY